MLDLYTATVEQVYEEFPNLEAMTTMELVVMKKMLKDSGEDEDMARAIEILLRVKSEKRSYGSSQRNYWGG